MALHAKNIGSRTAMIVTQSSGDAAGEAVSKFVAAGRVYKKNLIYTREKKSDGRRKVGERRQNSEMELASRPSGQAFDLSRQSYGRVVPRGYHLFL